MVSRPRLPCRTAGMRACPAGGSATLGDLLGRQPGAQPGRATRGFAGRCAGPQPGGCAPGRALGADVSGDDPDVFRLGSLLALGDVELDLLAFLRAGGAAAGDRADVHEHVRAPLHRDEAVASPAVEPLHRALWHLDLLRCGCPPATAAGNRASCDCYAQPVTSCAGASAVRLATGAGRRERRADHRVPGLSCTNLRTILGSVGWTDICP